MPSMVSVVVPTFNEAKNLPVLVERISAALKGKKFEIIVVDDNSPDGTGAVADRLAKKFPVIAVHRKQKVDLSSAVIEGFSSAKGDVIGVMDADLSHPPEVIAKLLAPIESGQTDFVVASRLVKGGGAEEWPFHRKLISFFASLLALPLTSVRDPMSGFFFFNKKILEGVELKPCGYKICLELLVKTRHKKVVEVPYIFLNRSFGESKLTAKEHVNYLKHVLRLYAFKLGLK
ncbi:MAG: polyprenol monophosphomannose synthase [Candidatus Diapherotrites archaeon]